MTNGRTKAGTFAKGNPGKPKGALSKKTKQWAAFSEWFMGEGIERLGREMAMLEGKEFITTSKDLLEYFQPKLARSEHTGKDGKDLFPKPIIDVPTD